MIEKLQFNFLRKMYTLETLQTSKTIYDRQFFVKTNPLNQGNFFIPLEN